LTCDDITPAFPQVGATVPPIDTEDAILALVSNLKFIFFIIKRKMKNIMNG